MRMRDMLGRVEETVRSVFACLREQQLCGFPRWAVGAVRHSAPLPACLALLSNTDSCSDRGHRGSAASSLIVGLE